MEDNEHHISEIGNGEIVDRKKRENSKDNGQFKILISIMVKHRIITELF